MAELNKYIVGQGEAKKSVSIALRNRWRRKRLSEDMQDEIIPKNILLIGPTGVGKTEIARRLAKHGAYDLAGVCAVNPKVLRREFGKNAEYLIDHAWGLEACTVEQARGYRPRGHSLTNGQVLMRDYSCREVETLLREMVLGSALELVEKGLCAQVASVYVGYSASKFPPPIVGEVRAVRRRGRRRGRVGEVAQAHQRRGRADRRRAGNLSRARNAGAFHPSREHSAGGPDARR